MRQVVVLGEAGAVEAELGLIVVGAPRIPVALLSSRTEGVLEMAPVALVLCPYLFSLPPSFVPVQSLFDVLP